MARTLGTDRRTIVSKRAAAATILPTTDPALLRASGHARTPIPVERGHRQVLHTFSFAIAQGWEGRKSVGE